MGKKEAVIDGSVVPEYILGELNRTSFQESSGDALRLKLEKDGELCLFGRFETRIAYD